MLNPGNFWGFWHGLPSQRSLNPGYQAGGSLKGLGIAGLGWGWAEGERISWLWGDSSEILYD